MPMPPRLPVFQYTAGEFARLFRHRAWHAVALGLALGISDFLTASQVFGDSEVWRLTDSRVPPMLLDKLLCLLVAVAALTAVQAWVRRPQARLFAMCFAVVVAAMLSSALTASERWNSTISASSMSPMDFHSLRLYLLWATAAFGILLGLLYEWQLRADQGVLELRQARISAEAVEREVLESRLHAMKARVDPEFLFAVIERTQTLYQQDVGAAEGLLEQLIDFLRASLPRGAEAGATVAQELRLCEAYLLIEKAVRAGALSCQHRPDADTRGGYFPPGILLPLLQSLLPPRGQPAPAVHLSVTVQRLPTGIRIELTCHAPLPPPAPDVLEAARGALRAMFEGEVSVRLRGAPLGGQTICVEVPHVAT